MEAPGCDCPNAILVTMAKSCVLDINAWNWNYWLRGCVPSMVHKQEGHHGKPYKEKEYGIRYDVTIEILFKNNCKCNVTFINIKLTT